MLLARLITALLLLAQPLPALGLESLLPCAQGCGHCGAAETAADQSSCGCGLSEEAPPQPDCSCAHEAPPAQPCAPAATIGLYGGTPDCEAPRQGPAPLLRNGVPEDSGGCAPGLGHDPPPRRSMLCVWRN